MPPLKICRPGPGPRGPVRKYGPGSINYMVLLAQRNRVSLEMKLEWSDQ